MGHRLLPCKYIMLSRSVNFFKLSIFISEATANRHIDNVRKYI